MTIWTCLLQLKEPEGFRGAAGCGCGAETRPQEILGCDLGAVGDKAPGLALSTLGCTQKTPGGIGAPKWENLEEEGIKGLREGGKCLKRSSMGGLLLLTGTSKTWKKKR